MRTRENASFLFMPVLIDFVKSHSLARYSGIYDRSVDYRLSSRNRPEQTQQVQKVAIRSASVCCA
jgi:hypothetical protein